ncbi:MAG: hypothetical protein KH972_01295 [Peptostreptococcaceae bacterium]|nr:hypothetical protein [uncultured Criibacterium sp.]MBS6062485.1 hypothetical protein [Peptostreptococcaceae bacterium]
MKERYEIINKIIEISPMYGEFSNINTVKKESYIYKLYENDKLGMYICEKPIDDEIGFEKAGENLNIFYPYIQSSNVQMNVIANKQKYNIKELSTIVENISNAVKEIDSEASLVYKRQEFAHNMTNSVSLHLNYEDMEHSFYLKSKEQNITLNYKKLDEEIINSELLQIVNAINRPSENVKVSDFKYFIIPSSNEQIYDYFEKILHPKYVKENNLLNKQLFSDKINLYTSLNYEDKHSLKYKNLAFFDFEGSYNQYYKNVLIRDGQVVKPYSDKRLEQEYETENTACSYLDNDHNFCCGLIGAHIEPTNTDFDEKSALLLPFSEIEYDGDFITINAKSAFYKNLADSLCKIDDFIYKADIKKLFSENFVGTTDKYKLSGDMANGLIFKF